MKLWLSLLALSICISTSGQVNTFPYSESFEETFEQGSNTIFITHWTGNKVANSNRIYQGSDARTGSASLNIVPISSFSGELQLSLDLSGVNNPKMSFYAYSKKNGSSSSSRPVILSISTSINGGDTFLDEVQIGDDATFPNDNTTSYTQYNYQLPAEATNNTNTIIKISVKRGSGSGSAAELVLDDFLVEQQNLPLEISSATSTSSTSVSITFNQDVTQASAEEISNYTINHGINIIEAVLTNSNQATLTTTAFTNTEYTLVASNIIDSSTNTIHADLINKFFFIQSLSIEAIKVSDSHTLEIVFNLALDKESAETVLNYSVNSDIGSPISANLLGDGRLVKLSFSDDLKASEYKLNVSGVRDTSKLANSENLESNFSYLPLTIIKVEATSSTEIDITFNQAVDHGTSTSLENYLINYDIGKPVNAIQATDDSSKITLTLERPMVNNTYSITIENVKNEIGNARAYGLVAALPFTTGTHTREIVINEIFADPSGEHQPEPLALPNETGDEFVELYNTTSNAIDIGGFELSGGRINSFVIEPKSYVILTKSSIAEKFKAFGNVASVTSWNTLSNGGEQLILKDNLGNIVDSLTYSLDWYKSDEKSEGGWSLSQINPELACSDINNWSASISSQGGSPGATNANFDNSPDIKSPNLMAVYINSDQSLSLVFDELMDANALVNATYTLDNGVNVSSTSFPSTNTRSIVLNLDKPMTTGLTYSLSVSGASDCAGNIIDNNEAAFLFDNLAPVLQDIVFKDSLTIDLLFDEVLSTNGSEDEGNYSIEPGGVEASNATLNNADPKRIHLSLSAGLLLDSSYTLTYRNLSDTLNNTIESASSRFDFENQIDTLIVVSNHLIDVYFKESPSRESTETLSNYLISNNFGQPETASLDSENDQLLHLVFADNFPENRLLTLGFEDIFDPQGTRIQLLNTPFIYDTDDPDVDTLIVLDENSLQVYFDEPLEIISAESINNYKLKGTNHRPSSAILSDDKSSVILHFLSNFEPEEVHTLTLTGLIDLSRNRVTSNRNYHFVFDLLPPNLVELKRTSPQVLSLVFSEAVDPVSAEVASNYEMDNSIGNPISAEMSKRNPNIVTLQFESFGNNASNLLKIFNISDLQGNVRDTLRADSFSSQELNLGSLKILSDTSIQLQFSKELTKASALDLENYDFNEELEVDSLFQNQDDSSIVNLFLKTPMIENSEYILTMFNLTDTDGNVSDSLGHSLAFENAIASISVTNPNTLVIDFKRDLSELESETTTNYTLRDNTRYPLSVIRNADEKNQVTLFYQQPFARNQSHTLRVQHLKDLFDEQIPSAAKDFIYDVKAPEIIAINPTYVNEIEVVFNEPIDPATAQTLNHYRLNNQTEPTGIFYYENASNSVVLTFQEDLINRADYTLTVKRVKDLSHNEIENGSFGFVFKNPEKPFFRDLVINEIYFHTDQEASLPNNEFVEIYNRSDKDFLLTDFLLTDKRDTATFPSDILLANTHLILTSSSGRDAYTQLGNTISLSHFPSLSNTGETIFLLDREFNIIDSLQYDRLYYNDTAKANGGFSIELVNPFNHCFDIDNYHASEDALGGTPGKPNSVLDVSVDVLPPTIYSLNIHSTSQLSLRFSEAMDINSITKENFQLDGDLSILDLQLIDDFGKQVLISLTTPFIKGEAQTITVSGVADCSGNVLSDTVLNFSLGASPQAGDLIFTEIMASPSPSQGLPEAEYLEILNVSNKILSLNGVTLSDASNAATLSAVDLNPGEYLILTPTATVSEFIDFGHSLAVSNWPSLNNSGDRISLHDLDGNEIYSLHYADVWYRSNEKAAGGFSLEIIDTNYPCLLETNWAASINSLGGSPGKINSINGDNPDLQGPQIVNAISLDPSTIQIDFNERLNGETIDLENFSADNELSFIYVSINEDENSVTLTTNVDLLDNTVYELTVNNITDCSGNLIGPSNSNIKLIIAGKADPLDILINEVLFNPRSGGVRFVEIYNNSEKYINLKNWRISGLSNQKVISEENLFMNPASFYTITNDGVILKDNYPNAKTHTFLEVSTMPSLSSAKGSVFLIDQNSIQIDGIAYDESYHSSLISDYKGISLERLRFDGLSNDPNNWFSAASTSNNATPGYENSQSRPFGLSTGVLTIDPPAFAPDIPGHNNFTTINYSFDTPGNVVNLKIMSADGKLVRQIAQNAITGTKGFFRWAGIDTRGAKARIGYYMIVFEVITPGGQVSYLLDKVALSSRLKPY